MNEIAPILVTVTVFLGLGYVQSSSDGIGVGKMLFWVFILIPAWFISFNQPLIIASIIGLLWGFILNSHKAINFLDSIFYRMKGLFKKHVHEEDVANDEPQYDRSAYEEEMRRRAEESENRKQSRNESDEQSSNNHSNEQEKSHSKTDSEYEDLKREVKKAKQEARRAKAEAERLKSESISSTNNDSRSPEEILGLTSGFTKADLKVAYKRESARFHENKWVNKPPDVQKAMQDELKKINGARDKLLKYFQSIS